MIRLCDRLDVASHTHLAISVANWVWNFVFWKELRTLMIFRFSCCNPLWVFLGGLFVVCTSREIARNLDPFRDVAKIVSSWGKRKEKRWVDVVMMMMRSGFGAPFLFCF